MIISEITIFFIRFIQPKRKPNGNKLIINHRFLLAFVISGVCQQRCPEFHAAEGYQKRQKRR
jgi:hypothetical protein